MTDSHATRLCVVLWIMPDSLKLLCEVLTLIMTGGKIVGNDFRDGNEINSYQYCKNQCTACASLKLKDRPITSSVLEMNKYITLLKEIQLKTTPSFFEAAHIPI